MQPNDSNHARDENSQQKPTGPPADPNGPRQRAAAESRFGVGSALGIVIVAGGTAFAMMSNVLMPARGATRSAHLVWEQRQQEIDAAIAAQSALYGGQPSEDELYGKCLEE